MALLGKVLPENVDFISFDNKEIPNIFKHSRHHSKLSFVEHPFAVGGDIGHQARRRLRKRPESRPRTFFSPSMYLLMAITELPVRSFKAIMASLMSRMVVMALSFVLSLPCFVCRFLEMNDLLQK